MSISTSVDFNVSLNQIITRSLKLLQVLEKGQEPDAADYADGKEAINSMLKAWQTQDIHLFGKAEGVLVPIVDTVKYLFSNASTSAHIAREEDFFITTLSAAEAVSQTILSVTNTANIAVDDHIGITLSDGSVFWTTVASKTSNTVTVDDALTGAASSSANVYSYTTRIDRPVKIRSARSYRVTDGTEVTINPLTRDEYFEKSQKRSNGNDTTEFYYDPQITTGNFYIWPQPDTITNLVKFTYQRQIADMDAITDNVDFPQEWIDAIVYNLAVRLAPYYGRFQEMTALLPFATALLENCMLFDNEPQSLTMSISRHRNARD